MHSLKRFFLGLFRPETAIIGLAVFAVYFNALFNGFVYDDNLQILQNFWIRDIGHLPDIFLTSAWSFGAEPVISNYYRPMMHVIYLINYHLFGLAPWGFHLVNILFHAAVSVLVFLVSSILLSRNAADASPTPKDGKAGLRVWIFNSPAFIAALLFAAHPIHTEAVTWVAGVPDLSFAFFSLLSLYFYIQATDKEQGSSGIRPSYVYSVVFFFIAALCKEPALTLPLILAAYDGLFRSEKTFSASTVKRLSPYLAASAVYIILRMHALEGFAPQTRHAELTPFEYFINIFPLAAMYIGKLLLPINLTAFYVFHPVHSIFELKSILSISAVAAYVLLCIFALRKNRTVFFSLLIMTVPLLPALYIPGLGENTFAERYLYLPSFGFAVISALALTRLCKLQKTNILIVAVVIILALYSTGSIMRNAIWRDDISLFSETVVKSPDGAIPHLGLGIALRKKGDIDKAIGHFQAAVKLRPDYADAYNSLGEAYEASGWIDPAIEQYLTAISLKPDSAAAYNNLGYAYERKGYTEQALNQYQTALKLNPYFAEAYNNIGAVYGDMGMIDEAIRMFETVLRLQPDFSAAHYNIAVDYLKKGMIDQAIYHLETAVRLDPSDPDFRTKLKSAYNLRHR